MLSKILWRVWFLHQNQNVHRCSEHWEWIVIIIFILYIMFVTVNTQPDNYHVTTSQLSNYVTILFCYRLVLMTFSWSRISVFIHKIQMIVSVVVVFTSDPTLWIYCNFFESIYIIWLPTFNHDLIYAMYDSRWYYQGFKNKKF